MRYSHLVETRARSCEVGLKAAFSDGTCCAVEYLFLGDSWNPAIPLHELAAPLAGRLQFTPWFTGWGSCLVPDQPVADLAATCTALRRSLGIADGAEAEIPYDRDVLVLGRDGERLRACNRAQRGQRENHVESAVYDVPWAEYVRAVDKALGEMDKVRARLAAHLRSVEAPPTWSAPRNGLALRARLETGHRLPASEPLRIVVELRNAGSAPLSLMDAFGCETSSVNSVLVVRVVSRANAETLRRRPLTLAPGEIRAVSLTREVPAASRIDAGYFAVSDFSQLTNMYPPQYLRRVGEHFDLSSCWDGELAAPSLYLLRG